MSDRDDRHRTGRSPDPIPGPGGSDQREWCEECDRETAHSVKIELRTESGKRENAKFSREPYRVSTCEVCDAETYLRMNNA